jgi:hypothetical protein
MRRATARSASIAIMTAFTATAISAATDEKPGQLTPSPELDKVEARCTAYRSLDYMPMSSPFLTFREDHPRAYP